MGDCITPENKHLTRLKIARIRAIIFLANIGERYYAVYFNSYEAPMDTHKTMAPKIITDDYLKKHLAGKAGCLERLDGSFMFITSGEYQQLLTGTRSDHGRTKRVDVGAIVG